MLFVDWIRKVTVGDPALDVEENSLRVTLDDKIAAAVKAKVDEARNCNEIEMIEQLKKINLHLSMITGNKL